jgi:hypothetical protein
VAVPGYQRRSVLHGELTLAEFDLTDYGSCVFEVPVQIETGEKATFTVARTR